ncbi:hypothetical protein [Nostoc sp. NZL]|uniref:hypothetical protein n=1 Tax=Nostoc sp. NZL TaxID=2650612 RepID=UPI0018C71678|nr:hypothetical protein [Nostoc sp. NZL]MBG1244086.1 hypothetical protein [Nostoc sp. NZL]MBG1244920.1 hypothetical protein [Nostoc sp. NZL]
MRYNITSRGLGHGTAHTCQLNVKAILEAAFRYCLVPSRRLGMPSSLAGGRAARSSISSPEAGNEI